MLGSASRSTEEEEVSGPLSIIHLLSGRVVEMPFSPQASLELMVDDNIYCCCSSVLEGTMAVFWHQVASVVSDSG